MSDRTRGSRSRGEQDYGQDYGRSSGRGSYGDAWDEPDGEYADHGRGGSRRPSGGSRYASPPRSQRYDDAGYEQEDYAERRPRAAGGQRSGGGVRSGRGLMPARNDGASRARGGRGPYGQGRRSGGSRGAITALVVLLVVIALAVVGILVVPGHVGQQSVQVPDSPFATYTPGATPTVDVNFKVFTSARSHYAVIYPQAWNATSDQRTTQSQYDYIDTFALQNAPSRMVVEQAGAFIGYTDQQLIADEVSNAQQNGVTFTKTDTQPQGTPSPAATAASKTPTSKTPTTQGGGSAQTQKVGGATWTRQDYSVDVNGNPVHMEILACHHSGRGYVIVVVSTAAEFGNDDQAVFEPMLASFKFT